LLPGAHELELHALEWSRDGAPLLLLHGFGHDAHVWDDVAPALAGRYRTLALDHRGHGESDRDPKLRDSHEAIGKDLEVLTRELPGPCAVVGHSMGAYGALHLIARHPDRVSALVLVDAGLDLTTTGVSKLRFQSWTDAPSFADHSAYQRVLQKMFPLAPAATLARLAQSWLRPREDGRLELKLDLAFLRPRGAYDPRVDRAAWAERESAFLWGTLAEIRVPTLVVRGAESVVLTRETAQRMVDILRDGQLAEVASAGHAVMIDNPIGLTATLDAFLRRAARSGRSSRRREDMSEVEVVEEIAAPAAKVWELMRDFGGLTKWASAIESCEVEGQGVGAVRTLGMPGGLSLKERLEAFDDAGRTFSYAIIGDNPLPLRDYLSVVKITEKGANACICTWRGTFEPEGGSGEQTQKMVRGIYTGSLAALKKTLGV
jgi:pimeloyl-ACP methyl ester carboxylesterase